MEWNHDTNNHNEMKLNILIIENEIYLAQSISARLLELEHTCDICISLEENIKDEHYDIVLLSTNINGQDFGSIIKKYENSIVILMVSYVSSHTVSIPLSLGAKDYLIKPFLIDDLIRKIDHYVDYEVQKQKIGTYEKYLSSTFKKAKVTSNETELQFPLFIFSNLQKDADAFAYQYAFKNDLTLDFLMLNDNSMPVDLDKFGTNLVYIKGFDTLNKYNRRSFLKLIQDKNVMIENCKNIDVEDYPTFEIDSKKSVLSANEILPIEEYIKFIISNYQDKFSDTKLSEYLGMSRKSIWEKRKKHGITK